MFGLGRFLPTLQPKIEPKNRFLQDLELHVTLWPSFAHFPNFAFDDRIAGIRLNSAMMSNPEVDKELSLITRIGPSVPLYFDIKGRQLRVAKVDFNPDYLDMTLNHPISVNLPIDVYFKTAKEKAKLVRLEEGGQRLIFESGPPSLVYPGESLHIFDPSLQVLGLFNEAEKAKIEKVRSFGFKKYFLSYVEHQRDVDEFLELVGRDCEVWLKIESRKGLSFVSEEFRKQDNLVLVLARGDLFVEVAVPDDILPATRLVIQKDPKACAGSRILLTTFEKVENPKYVPGLVEGENQRYLFLPRDPDACDLSDLAWLYDLGYRRMLLCDELCMYGSLLSNAVMVFDSFRSNYPLDRT